MDKEKDVAELLDAIVWGRRIIEIPRGEDQQSTFVLRPLTLEERNMSNYVYQQGLRQHKLRGILARETLVKDAIRYGLWKPAYDEEAKLLSEELLKVTPELEKEEQVNVTRLERLSRTEEFRDLENPITGKLKSLRLRSTSLQNTIDQINSDRAQYIDLPSAEYQAEIERGNYCLRCATLSFPEMDQVWGSLEDLEKETNTRLVASLLNAYYKDTIADESEIRQVARSGFWRCKWIGSKKNRGVKTLFNKEMCDLTLDQFRLVYWSQVYDSAYESMDAPSDEVIDDDKLFDRWLEEQNQKRKQDSKQSAFNKKVSHLTQKGQEAGFNVQGEFCETCTCGIKEQADARGADKRGHAHDPSCSYGVYLYYSKDKKAAKIEEIQSANPERTRRVLANEQKRLARMGVEGVEEQHLRGDKTRGALGLPTTTHGAGEFGKGKQGRARPQ